MDSSWHVPCVLGLAVQHVLCSCIGLSYYYFSLAIWKKKKCKLSGDTFAAEERVMRKKTRTEKRWLNRYEPEFFEFKEGCKPVRNWNTVILIVIRRFAVKIANQLGKINRCGFFFQIFNYNWESFCLINPPENCRNFQPKYS